MYVKESEALMKEVNHRIKQSLSELREENKMEWKAIKQQIKKSVGEFLFSKTKRKPMIIPIIIEI